MTTPANTQMDDPDIHKGAIEGDRPSDEQNVNNKGKGVDKNGLRTIRSRRRRTKKVLTRIRRQG